MTTLCTVLLLPLAMAAGYAVSVWQCRGAVEAAHADGFTSGRLAERDARAFADAQQGKLYVGKALRLVRRMDA